MLKIDLNLLTKMLNHSWALDNHHALIIILLMKDLQIIISLQAITISKILLNKNSEMMEANHKEIILRFILTIT